MTGAPTHPCLCRQTGGFPTFPRLRHWPVTDTGAGGWAHRGHGQVGPHRSSALVIARPVLRGRRVLVHHTRSRNQPERLLVPAFRHLSLQCTSVAYPSPHVPAQVQRRLELLEKAKYCTLYTELQVLLFPTEEAMGTNHRGKPKRRCTCRAR